MGGRKTWKGVQREDIDRKGYNRFKKNDGRR